MKFSQPVEPVATGDSSYPVVEPGEYYIYLDDAEGRTTKDKGYSQVLCRFKGEGINILQGFFFTYPNNPKAQEIGRKMLGQIGSATNHGAYIDTDEVRHKWMKAQLKIDEYDGKKSNKVHWFIDPDYTREVPVVFDSMDRPLPFETALERVNSEPGPTDPGINPEDDLPF